MALRHRHRNAAGEDRAHLQPKNEIWRPAHNRFLFMRRGCVQRVMRHSRRLLQKYRCGRRDDEKLESGVIQHGMPPAGIGDRAREYRRPDRAGEISAARNQGQRRTAAAVEPAADIDIGRGVDAADADQADEQTVADIKRPRWTQSRQRQPDRDHRCAEHHRPAHADPLGDPAHEDAADAGADPHQRAGKGRNRALAVDLGGDVLERDDGDPWRAKGNRHDHKDHAGDDPRGPRLDR